mgnify:CR=1 FL=1
MLRWRCAAGAGPRAIRLFVPYCGPLSSRPCTLTCASYPLFGPKTALTLHNRALSSLPMSRLRLSDESVTQTDRSHEKQLQRNSRRCVSLCAAPPPPFVCGRTSSRAWPGRAPAGTKHQRVPHAGPLRSHKKIRAPAVRYVQRTVTPCFPCLY